MTGKEYHTFLGMLKILEKESSDYTKKFASALEEKDRRYYEGCAYAFHESSKEIARILTDLNT